MGAPPGNLKARNDPATLCSILSPVIAVVIVITVTIAAIAIGVVGLAISALVAFAILVFVAAFVAHPVLVAARVFPVIVLEFEAAAALDVGLTDSKAVAIAISVTLIAGVVAAIVAIVAVASPRLAPGHTSE
jgi:hypothetical protein